ncbi:hypothetical protein BDZ91DRAFT_650468 [Kalaharituber pfeilii]|nr:hypothetical protein BDZ91DRAFT_650468 [Kalaharituber pfeilii]
MLCASRSTIISGDTILTSAICASKEYFSKAIGPVKTCSLSYGPNGQSRGIATISFSKAGDAEKAAISYNGVLVDKRPMKVELVLEPKAPGLETRVGAPNPVASTPAKQAAKPKPVTTAAKGNIPRGRGGRRGGARGGRSIRPKPKSAEELDAEMADYWDGNNQVAAGATVDANGAQYVNTTGATLDAMDDEVMVRTLFDSSSLYI